MSYEEIYGVALLDDLHNYFPALLYDTDRFLNIQQVFQYMRHQIYSRFNLFNYGQAAYREQTRERGPAQASAPVIFGQPGYDFFNRAPAPAPAQPAAARGGGGALAGVGALAGTGGLGEDLDFLIRFLANPMIRLNPVHLNPNAQAFQPVLVRPSQRVLEENTQVIEGILDTCAICQDSITANEQCRLLVPCRHRFHRVCIDQWFQRSVFCPTCRHDIRVAAEAPTETPAE